MSIKHPDADQLARALAAETGETITDAVIHALRERLERYQRRRGRHRLRDDVARIQRRYQQLPVLDPRSSDEIIGYDDLGLS